MGASKWAHLALSKLTLIDCTLAVTLKMTRNSKSPCPKI
jgi:hypothetical protein